MTGLCLCSFISGMMQGSQTEPRARRDFSEKVYSVSILLSKYSLISSHLSQLCFVSDFAP